MPPTREPGGVERQPVHPTEKKPASGLDLGGLQRWFLDRMVAPHRRTGTPAPGPDVSQVIVPSRALTAEQRLGLHSQMYMLRLREVMAKQYEVVARLAGSNDFAELVRGYLERYPPRSYTLNDLGHAFPRYLERHVQRADAALLYDVAQLERAINDAHDVHAMGTVTAENLAEIPAELWGEVRFRMDPSVHLLAFEHDACGIVNAHKAGRELPDRSPRRTWAAVWRSQDFTVWRKPLTAPMYAALSALAAGDTVGSALERAAAAWDGDEAELESRVFQWFSEWLSEGYFAVLLRPPAAAR